MRSIPCTLTLTTTSLSCSQIETKFNGDATMTYTCRYTPRAEGRHRVVVLFADRPVPRSPFTVSVEGHVGDPSRVTASGPGLRPSGVVVGRPTYFDLFTKGQRCRVCVTYEWYGGTEHNWSCIMVVCCYNVVYFHHNRRWS